MTWGETWIGLILIVNLLAVVWLVENIQNDLRDIKNDIRSRR